MLIMMKQKLGLVGLIQAFKLINKDYYIIKGITKKIIPNKNFKKE